MGKEARVSAQANHNQVALTSQATDLAVVMKSVRDLAKTASFSHMKDLEELHQLAYNNLKSKMVVDENGNPGVLMVDPGLCMEAFKLISGVLIQTVETKRKAADTLLKARALLDSSVPVQDDDAFDDDAFDGDAFDGEEPDGVVIQEAGVFGGVFRAGGVSDESEKDGDSEDGLNEPPFDDGDDPVIEM
jgi:hypothetical protein